jgi:hypothetical protein
MAGKGMFVQQMQTLCQVDRVRSREPLQMAQDISPLLQATRRQFPDHHGMRPD